MTDPTCPDCGNLECDNSKCPMKAPTYILGHRHVYKAGASKEDTRTAVAEIMGRGWHTKAGRQANFGIKLLPSGTYYPLPQYLYLADIKRDIATILDNIQKDQTL